MEEPSQAARTSDVAEQSQIEADASPSGASEPRRPPQFRKKPSLRLVARRPRPADAPLSGSAMLIGDGAPSPSVPAAPPPPVVDAAASQAQAPAKAQAPKLAPRKPTRDLAADAWRRAGRENAIYARRLEWSGALADIAHLLNAPEADAGAETLARAAATWQLREGLAPDGVIGPQTWSRLQSRLRSSSRLSRRTPSIRRLIERRWIHDNPAPQTLALSRDTLLLWNFPLDGATVAPKHADALTGFVSERLRRVASVFKTFRVVVRINGVASSSEAPDIAAHRANAASRLLIRRFAVRAGDMIEVTASSAAKPVTCEKTGRGYAMNRSVRARLVFLKR